MTLINCYLPVFRLGYEFTQYPEKYSDYSFFRETCISLLKQSALDAEGKYDQSDCESALLAVVIWLDERVLCSGLPWVIQWRSALLQTHLFQTSIGGELFFTRLAEIPEDRVSLHRFCLFCLMTGFYGKYARQNNVLLEQIIAEEKFCLPPEWRIWPNEEHITRIEPTTDTNELTCWGVVKNSQWLWLITTVSIYIFIFLGAFIYFG